MWQRKWFNLSQHIVDNFWHDHVLNRGHDILSNGFKRSFFWYQHLVVDDVSVMTYCHTLGACILRVFDGTVFIYYDDALQESKREMTPLLLLHDTTKNQKTSLGTKITLTPCWTRVSFPLALRPLSKNCSPCVGQIRPLSLSYLSLFCPQDYQSVFSR